jgi:50S ribosomal subunit-associated GTPase HflX
MTDYEKTILRELKSKGIPYIIVANKSDLPGSSVEKIRKDAGFDCLIMPVSAMSGSGVDALLNVIMDMVNRLTPVNQLVCAPMNV